MGINVAVMSQYDTVVEQLGVIDMCMYCEEDVELPSSNFCGSAKMTIAGNYLDVRGDKEVIKWFRRIYQPSFRICFCPMCGKRLGDD